MKNHYSLKLALLFSASVLQLAAYHEKGWYIMPKVGAAPGFYTSRGHLNAVFPSLGITCPTQGTATCAQVLTSPQNVLLQDCNRQFKFSEVFSNGVLYVGGEVGYSASCHCQYFVDLIYQRASGADCRSFTASPIQALEGCACNSNDDCNNCTPLITPITTTNRYDNFTTFGAYLGHRYYFNRVWCDSVAFFLGVKVGVMRRNAVGSTSTYPAVVINGTTIFAERNLSFNVYCKSSALSGGLQVGADYCINDCLDLMVGAEVLATAPLKVNKNIPTPFPTSLVEQFTAADFPFTSNVIIGQVGHLIQFPIWVGLRWTWDTCCN